MSQQTALVIIDVQAGFFSGPDAAYQAPAILERIRHLRDRARAAGVPVIYMQHDGDPGGAVAPGTPGWQIHPALAPAPDELVVRKRASDSFFETALAAELAARAVGHLVLAGYRTQYCVDTTSRQAISRGFDVTLAGDAHSTTDTTTLTAAQIIAHHNETLDDFGTDQHVVVVKDSNQIAF